MGAPLAMLDGPAFVRARSAAGLTLSVALAAITFGPMLVVSAPAGIVFTCAAPAVDEVTSITSRHVPFAGTVPPASEPLVALLAATPPAPVVLTFRTRAVATAAAKLALPEVTRLR